MPRILTALILASITLAATPIRAAEPFIRKGPYLSLAPFTQAIHLNMEYTLPDYTTRVTSEEWLPFLRFAGGIAFSEKVAMGFEYGTSYQSYDEVNHYYSTTLIRLSWFPTGGRWYLTGGAGIGSAEAPLEQWPGYDNGMAYDSSWLVTLGAGYEIPVLHAFAVQFQVDWMQQRSFTYDNSSGHAMDVDSWALGATLVWYP